jgi:NADPH:quinone reductase
MKAAYIEETGPPDKIIYGELAMPQLGPGQVLVKVGAVAINPIDTYIRAGAVAMPLTFPFVVGCDLAGMVERVGPDVTLFKAGDRVWGSNQGLLGRQGTFAEYVAVDEQWLYPTPANVGDETAAAVALVGITAHLGLFRHAQLRSGETLFINGGAGGVGSMVVQMAKSRGARVVATAGCEENLALCRQYGADLAINYKRADVDAAVREFAPKGIDVWWETVREPDFGRTFGLLAERGRMILMAGRDARPVFPVGAFYVKQCSLFGFVVFKATADEQRDAAADINKGLAGGWLRPNIARVFPLSATAEAHRLQEENTIHKAGTLRGKIVLAP